MYNYPNYETERVAKYILHNNFFMNSLNLVIQDCLNSSVTKEYMAEWVAASIKDAVTSDIAESMCEASSLAKSIMNAALSNVNFEYLAESFVEMYASSKLEV